MCLHEWGYLLIASNKSIIFNWGNTSCVNQLQYISILSLKGKTQLTQKTLQQEEWQVRSLYLTDLVNWQSSISIHWILKVDYYNIETPTDFSTLNLSNFGQPHHIFTFWASSKLTPLCLGRGSLVGDVFWFSPPTAQFYVKTFRGRFDYLFPSFQFYFI